MSGPNEKPSGWRAWREPFSRQAGSDEEAGEAEKPSRVRWNMGMLNDPQTIEVPGSVLLLAQGRNEPLGLRNTPARTSHSSLPTGMPLEPPPMVPEEDDKKKTKDGQIILEPQPDDSHNDPLNWPTWRRDASLLSLGLFCMVGGGITPLIAAGFTDVAKDYDITVSRVALTTGLYMMGLGIGSVLFSPTAILYGKRPVYLFGAVIWILSAIWCALSPTFPSLILARIFQGIAVSPVECLPSATIAEIFFLHERAYRIGIYTLLLLGGKNLVPLVSAAIIQSLGWRWVFWIVAMVVGFSGCLLYLFVPETFWDRTPIPKVRSKRNTPKRPTLWSRMSSRYSIPVVPTVPQPSEDDRVKASLAEASGKLAQEQDTAGSPSSPTQHKHMHVGFAPEIARDEKAVTADQPALEHPHAQPVDQLQNKEAEHAIRSQRPQSSHSADISHHPPHPGITRSNSESASISSVPASTTAGQRYTHALRSAPPKSFAQQLQVYHGQLNHDKWWKVAVRPFILFLYPAVLWSAAVYACSIGWLIVISESIAVIFESGYYNFSALSTGLVYISPFIGGVLGTAVAGRVSDVIVRAMSRRNGGLYEPEFRLVMVIPITITTLIGLMGFGWSSGVHDSWIVPTIFFGLVSFGCSLGSTTSITFCVDSYRQYAGEALVTLNFSKNILHGMVFSFFVTGWVTTDGSKTVYIWLGVIQLIILLTTIPMYIYGKRARMWTVRKNFMEKW